MATVLHPNIAATYEVGTFVVGAQGKVFVAMEFIDGQTLRQVLVEGRRTVKELLGLTTQAGRGLAAAHRRGIVHRDFKPDNVLVGADGRGRRLHELVSGHCALTAGPAVAQCWVTGGGAPGWRRDGTSFHRK